MIRSLHLRDVGPAPELKFDLATRLNILTGDNGLGKTFVLDVLWWLLTTTWVSTAALPRSPPERSVVGWVGGDVERTGDGDGGGHGGGDVDAALHPAIRGLLAPRLREADSLDIESSATFDWARQDWARAPDRPLSTAGEAEPRPPTLVLYVRTDGSFAVWDSYRERPSIQPLGSAALRFDANQVWEGLRPPGAPPVCRGLIEDWRSWQKEGSPLFESLRRVLHELSDPDEPLVPGLPTRVTLGDAREIPVLSTSYGSVPVTLASAGVKRILGIAYLLVWAWNEHIQAARLTQRRPTRELVLLIDEAELHLHPKWQRCILPALVRAVGLCAINTAVQVVATTHSPLVLASLEPQFDRDTDALFNFDLVGRGARRRVKLEKMRDVSPTVADLQPIAGAP